MLVTLLLLLLVSPETLQFMTHRVASSFLSRVRRSNQVFEETRQGHLERECVEESCSREEAREVFENDPETNYFYPKYTECLRRYGPARSGNSDLGTCVHNIPNQCTPLPCNPAGYERCEDGRGGFKCICKPGWKGSTCEQDINECNVNNGGCEHTCSNMDGSYQCLCNKGFTKQPDNRRCRDNNECELEPGICGFAQCENSLGSYQCTCDPGYRYQSSTKTCEGEYSQTLHDIILAIENVIVYKLEGLTLCAGDKASVQLIVTKDRIVLESSGVVGSSPLTSLEMAELLSKLDKYMHISGLTFLGGVPDVPITSTPVTAFYKGCMETHINNNYIDLDEAVYKHYDIRSHSCPV
ncbi:vitamin K-dependent protein S-like [Scyliorhinus canicula]|uniref:vitamin K-dependent protein S-like n=1 Tax=Scyliorhinus canicula TaxID=7830 RepID=UPI0018F3C27A|nr:vitamin K-dependent protein S-like [Scyliorhinus canicula]